MAQVRVIVANEPKAYRDVIAAALRLIRPSADVSIVHPDALDDAIAEQVPHLVLSSRLVDDLACRPFDSVVLHPDGDNRGEISVGGQRSVVHDIDFDKLLSVYDEVAGPLLRGLATS